MPRAVVVASVPEARQVIGGLPLAVRAVLALRAAGVADVAVFAGSERPPLERLLARRGVAVRWLPDSGAAGEGDGSAPVLVVPGNVLVDARGVLRAPVCPAAALPGLVTDLVAGRPLAEALRRAGTAEGAGPGEGLFVPLGAAHPGGALETLLLDGLARHTAAGDSYLAALIDRRLSRPVTRAVLAWPVSPTQITLLSLVVGLAGAAGLATTSYATRLAGVLALVASIVLDCVDGEVARARYEQSAAGARLDVLGDYLVHLAVFVGLGVGLARQGLPHAGMWAGPILVVGVLASMVTMHALFVRPALTRGGDLHWAGDAGSLRGTAAAAVVEKLASRDYTYLLLVLALVGHLEWFLYAAAVGSWVFAGGLVLYAAVRRRWRVGCRA